MAIVRAERIPDELQCREIKCECGGVRCRTVLDVRIMEEDKQIRLQVCDDDLGMVWFTPPAARQLAELLNRMAEAVETLH